MMNNCLRPCICKINRKPYGSWHQHNSQSMDSDDPFVKNIPHIVCNDGHALVSIYHTWLRKLYYSYRLKEGNYARFQVEALILPIYRFYHLKDFFFNYFVKGGVFYFYREIVGNHCKWEEKYYSAQGKIIFECIFTNWFC